MVCHEADIHVLVVDDSSPVRERLVEMIADFEGVTKVNQAWDVATAIDQLRNNTPELLVLDLRMPGGGGVQILKELAHFDQSKPVVVVLTNYPYPQLRARCIELGTDYFLDKSADFEQIADIVADIRNKDS